VTSVDYFGSFLIGPLAPLLAATISERVGPGAIFLIGGAISFVFTLAVLALSRSVRQLR
jgi:hypothetical protein